MILEHKGKKFDVCGLQCGKKWWSVIYPTDAKGVAISRGLILGEPDCKAAHGPFVLFDSENEAIEAGKKVIIQDLLRE